MNIIKSLISKYRWWIFKRRVSKAGIKGYNAGVRLRNAIINQVFNSGYEWRLKDEF